MSLAVHASWISFDASVSTIGHSALQCANAEATQTRCPCLVLNFSQRVNPDVFTRKEKPAECYASQAPEPISKSPDSLNRFCSFAELLAQRSHHRLNHVAARVLPAPDILDQPHA